MRNHLGTGARSQRPTRRDVLWVAGAGALAAGGLARPAIAQTRNVSFDPALGVPKGPNLMTFCCQSERLLAEGRAECRYSHGNGSVGAAQAIGKGLFFESPDRT